jgi:hypothetical protein
MSGSVSISDPRGTELGVSRVARRDASPLNLIHSAELLSDGVFRRRTLITASE